MACWPGEHVPPLEQIVSGPKPIYSDFSTFYRRYNTRQKTYLWDIQKAIKSRIPLNFPILLIYTQLTPSPKKMLFHSWDTSNSCWSKIFPLSHTSPINNSVQEGNKKLHSFFLYKQGRRNRVGRGARQYEDSEEDLFKAESLSKLSTTRWAVRLVSANHW